MSRAAHPICFVAGQPAGTLFDVLEIRASRTPDRVVLSALEQARSDAPLTYARLLRRALRVATLLQTLQASRKPVLLLFPAGLDHATALFGCLGAGAIAVSALAPDTLERLARLRGLARDCAPAFVLCSDALFRRRAALTAAVPALAAAHWVDVCDAGSVSTAHWIRPVGDPSEVCLLHYSAGTTAEPKGAMVEHAGLLASLQRLEQALELRAGVDTGLCWLPPDQGLGLFVGLLAPVFSDVSSTLAAAEDFANAPERWLEAIAARQITLSGAPNAAYELCCQRAQQLRANLDLRGWRVAYGGAEALERATARRFASCFASRGFGSRCFVQSYGLAEAAPLLAAMRVEQSSASASCGTPAADHRVLIVDPERRTPCEEGQIGEIWLHGPSAISGYWGRPSLSRCCLRAQLAAAPPGVPRGPYVRSGDAGYFARSGLHVLGRLDDALRIDGELHFAEAIERSARACHPLLQRSGCAAFALPLDGAPRLILVVEVERPEYRPLQAALSAALDEGHGLSIHEIIFVRAGKLPRTAAGTIRRHAVRRAYLDGRLRPNQRVAVMPGAARRPALFDRLSLPAPLPAILAAPQPRRTPGAAPALDECAPAARRGGPAALSDTRAAHQSR